MYTPERWSDAYVPATWKQWFASTYDKHHEAARDRCSDSVINVGTQLGLGHIFQNRFEVLVRRRASILLSRRRVIPTSRLVRESGCGALKPQPLRRSMAFTRGLATAALSTF